MKNNVARLTSRIVFRTLLLATLSLSFAAAAKDKTAITPRPQLIKWGQGTGVLSPLSEVDLSQTRQGRAKKLWEAFESKLPQGGLPPEGYLLDVGPASTLVISGDALGKIRAQQTLRQIDTGDGTAPAVKIADWPDMTYRAFHLIPYTPASLPAVKRLVHEFLAPMKCNLLILQIDYHYPFVSHPEVTDSPGFSKQQIRDLVRECRTAGIRVVPLMNCLGHQSWKAKAIFGLLRSHPEFMEATDPTHPWTDPESKHFYTHAWCPSHPDIDQVVFDLLDELIHAFGSDTFHIGMDEVLNLASNNCPRCRGKDPAQLYADAVNTLYGHLAKRGQTVMIWGDRLLDAKRTGYDSLEASANGTHPAIDLIAKDIIICDWHYGDRKDYPSLDIFLEKGFRLMPTTSIGRAATKAFTDAARQRQDPKILGPVATVWYSALEMAAMLFGDRSYRLISPYSGAPLPADEIQPFAGAGPDSLLAVQETLTQAWNPESPAINQLSRHYA